MGGVVNTGRNNDDLIDKLISVDYIRTPMVERVFRAVDRADYFPSDVKRNAYKDLAWKGNNLHLSAPCIYSEVMEGLCLGPGLTFLNLGSGTGYLSTMVGLILGNYGINHGVEIHEDVIQYAHKRLEEFKKNSGAIDEFNFCEPKFIHGNCLCLTTHRQYDRVYCGAACPEIYETYMKNLLNVGGILVMPLNDNLVQVKRISEVTWECTSLLPVSFASLIMPINGKQEIIEIVDSLPTSLQSLCRTVIRDILRKNINLENPNLQKRKPVTKCVPGETALRQLVGPIFDDSGDDPFTSDEETQIYISDNRRPADDIIGVFMDQLGVRQQRGDSSQDDDYRSTENASSDTEDDDDELPTGPTCEINEARNILNNSRSSTETSQSQESQQSEDRVNIFNSVEGALDDVLRQCRRFDDGFREEEETPENYEDVLENPIQPAENPTPIPEASSKRREKFDSGLGEEIVERNRIPDSSVTDYMDVESSSSNDEVESKRNKRGSKRNSEARSSAKWRRICLHPSDSCSSSDTAQEDEITPTTSTLVRQRRYSRLMHEKIEQLPLPTTLKKYLNNYRDFF